MRMIMKSPLPREEKPHVGVRKGQTGNGSRTLAEVERSHIIDALKECRCVVGGKNGHRTEGLLMIAQGIATSPFA
jgi:hypothetical protein